MADHEKAIAPRRPESRGTGRDEEERYRRLFESLIVGIVGSDAEGRIASVNSAAAMILGYRGGQELVGRPVKSLWLDESDRQRALTAAEERGFLPPQEVVLRQRDGTPIHALATATLDRDVHGQFSGVTATFTDITELKLAEDELREYRESLEGLVEQRTGELAKTVDSLREEIEERREAEEALHRQREELQTILDSMPAMVFYKDRQGRHVRVNRALTETTGIPEEAWLGKTIREILPSFASEHERDDHRGAGNGTYRAI